ncbi:ABC transporter permease [Novosphingobium bradum]|uniref:ABC transporter permease n=1 Tax=Novosphingobium bradum TaxID=1737444 RepID=A0ABV7IS85_9SPHN
MARGPFAGRLGLLVHIASRHLLMRRRQTAVAVSGVAVGVGFFLAVSALMVGSQADFVKTLIDTAPHIIISDERRSPPPQPGVAAFGGGAAGGAVVLHGYKVRSEVRGIKDWQAILREIDRIPGAIGSPSLSGAVTLRVGGREEGLAVVGIDPLIETRVSTISDKLRVGRLIDLERVQGGVIIGEDQAQRLALGMGDIVAATSARGGTRNLKIVGLFKRGQMQLGSGTGYMLLREAQSLLGRPFVINRIGVKLVDPYDAEAVAKQLEQGHAYKAESWQERSADFLGLLLTRNVIMYTVVSAILLVASFGIYTAVSNSVADKRRDIAILRSIGFSQGDLQLVFVFEGLALAVVGVLLGWGLGYLLMGILGSLEFPITGDTQRLPIDRSSRQYLIAAAASLTAGIVAAWLPARRSAQVDPVDILRGAI